MSKQYVSFHVSQYEAPEGGPARLYGTTLPGYGLTIAHLRTILDMSESLYLDGDELDAMLYLKRALEALDE